MSRWLKIEVSTPDKWEILTAAEDCQCSNGDAFLAFFRLFKWLDEMTTDGVVLKATPRRIDGIAQLDGFARSLERSGWLLFTPEGMEVVNWCKHNGQSSKRRAENAQRMNDIREAKRKASIPVRPCPRPRQ